MEFLLVVSLRCFCCVLAQIPSSLSLRTSAFPSNTCTRLQGQTGNQSLLANLRSSQDSHDPLPVCDLQKNKAHSVVTNRSAERKGTALRLAEKTEKRTENKNGAKQERRHGTEAWTKEAGFWETLFTSSASKQEVPYQRLCGCATSAYGAAAAERMNATSTVRIQTGVSCKRDCRKQKMVPGT